MDLNEYLIAEFRRYFPDAASITTRVFNERVYVYVYEHGHRYEIYFECGSDDDWYSFANVSTGSIITIPLMPEA